MRSQAAGAMEYEGVATNEIHCSWLDPTLALVVKYLASKDKVFAQKLGATTISLRRLRNTSVGQWDLAGGAAFS